MSCYAQKKLGLLSKAFKDSQYIPSQYSREGGNISIPLTIVNAPKNALSFAIIMEDPDAPAPFTNPFVHWLIWNLHPCSHCGILKIPEGLSSTDKGVEGKNSFGNNGYVGPSPPPGDPVHHYVTTVYALDICSLKLPEGSSKSDLVTAFSKHTLGKATITGLFSTPRMTVQQEVSITNSVSIVGLTGIIITVPATLAPGQSAQFTVNNPLVGTYSTVFAKVIGYTGTQGIPIVNMRNITTGSFDFFVANVGTEDLNGSITINFSLLNEDVQI